MCRDLPYLHVCSYPNAPAHRNTTQSRLRSRVKVKATIPAMDRKYIPSVVPLYNERYESLTKQRRNIIHASLRFHIV